MNAFVKVKISADSSGKELYEVLASRGIPFSAPCGGQGTCGKCRVKLLGGSVVKKGTHEILIPDENGYFSACRAVVGQDGCEIALPEWKGETAADTPSDGNFTGDRFGIALDIGTTTLAAALVDLSCGKTVKTASALNPEATFGGDVMSRITASRNGHLLTMQSMLLKSVLCLAEELFSGQMTSCEAMTVVGNPTMLHIFLGISPEGMGAYPFTPAFVTTVRKKGAELSLPCDTITVLPSASAFIGSDVIAGAVVLGMAEKNEPCMLLDMGTNGEIVLIADGKLYAASCAAGPALEGAKISSGMGGVSGAVSSVKREGSSLVFKTVQDALPIGICGAGLIDLTACLLEDGTVDETGYLEEDFVLQGFHESASGRKAVTTEVVLIPEDIRELQLAKAALRAGMETLFEEAGLSHGALRRLYLAGGLGYYVEKNSCCRIGLFANDLKEVIQPVGNTALKGAISALMTSAAVTAMEELSQRLVTVELNDRPFFAECYMEEMLFPE